MDPFRKKSPEEILLSISKLHQGRLKVYIGAVSGSGKTYHMLREGHILKNQGIDVVISAVSTMRRPDTIEQIGDLDRVPSIHWYKGNEEKKDLNLELLVQRNPEVLLVDGLAHRNRKGAQHATRLEDIRFLLSRGISVITTVNVYELEDVRELASKLTGIRAVDTVPADTLELADEVVLIDVTPETMLVRAADGLSGGDSDLFKHGNLAVLRELTLRLVAEGVNESLERYRKELGLIGPSGADERILVSTQYHWNGSIYMRRGQQIAKRLNGDLLVVTFVNQDKELSKEQAAFKRSIVKLAKRIGAKFDELPLCSRRKLADVLVQYALEHHVTRIVLGHSKQTRWQELLQGSIIQDLLLKTRGVDIFIVADRAESDGERILPAQINPPPGPFEPFHRLNSQEIDQKIKQIKRGRFKVYIGAAPGVGKTYTMLREGNDLLKKGLHVLVGLLETHGRTDTQDQVGDLEVLPRNIIDYREKKLEEMNTEDIISRNPDVVLVDELAHTNVPGSMHKKRYEDVLNILAAGISVITTVNVQHLESLNDSVEQITGVRVRETVPDHILRLADEVQLIDVTPESLQQRMKDGKIYDMEKVNQALSHFFKTGNLIALRELALREIADDVDERLESWERSSSLRGPWRRQEVIYVCVDIESQAERLIRRGFRIAHRLKATWYVTFVQVEHMSQSPELPERLEALHTLTERLGGTFGILKVNHHKEIPHLLIAKADEAGATQMIIGQSKRAAWKQIRQGNIAKTLLRGARHMDVLVVADYEPMK
ncbi:two-component system, OmpR family, sensor histidine kinase KdpD [Paenibacillus uliginis N3/975]|uniref:Two-component system, OmpR family, sensor histidine kinase KdpD n=1 Tax=Paenibacillus uliginis N3/975 TaxID=1313296 RepID=A0A1X7G6I1_9BACL|nr:histidine kinase [Paenibacillus uliginis]SMF64928.1 two-component system, OmpR family, sensor histidine kinase KdpD [Paenibacillus uliginis N3/975]